MSNETTDRVCGLSFGEWCKELNLLAAAEPERYGLDAIRLCGAAAWIGYFEDGYSPADAWSEDGSYAG